MVLAHTVLFGRNKPGTCTRSLRAFSSKNVGPNTKNFWASLSSIFGRLKSELSESQSPGKKVVKSADLGSKKLKSKTNC